MKPWRLLPILTLALFAFLSSYAYANSSWVWVRESPFHILPVVIICTLLIETVVISLFGKVRNTVRAFSAICLANLLSFLVPVLVRADRMVPVRGGFALANAFEGGPNYIIMAGYLFLTILVELPVVYLFLKKHSQKERSLAVSIVLVNFVTTALAAVVERMTSVGHW